MSRLTQGVLALTAIVALHQVAATASGSSMGSGASMPGESSAAPRTPAELARESYDSGIAHKDKARKLEEQMAKETFRDPKDHDKAEGKIKDEYQKGLKDFMKAAELDPSLYQAYNGMGYTLRKTGAAAKALEMYDKALQMAPGFPDAMEYRGEAYLALGRVEDAKQSYMMLFAKDRTQADLLMKAMVAFVAKAPAGVDPTAVAALDRWLKERATIASTTVAMGLRSNQTVWK